MIYLTTAWVITLMYFVLITFLKGKLSKSSVEPNGRGPFETSQRAFIHLVSRLLAVVCFFLHKVVLLSNCPHGIRTLDSSTAKQIMENLLGCCLRFEITASHAELFGPELVSRARARTRQTGNTVQQSRENPGRHPLSKNKSEKKKPTLTFVRLTHGDKKTHVPPSWAPRLRSRTGASGVGRCVFVFHLCRQLLFWPPATLVGGWESGVRVTESRGSSAAPARSNRRGH